MTDGDNEDHHPAEAVERHQTDYFIFILRVMDCVGSLHRLPHHHFLSIDISRRSCACSLTMLCPSARQTTWNTADNNQMKQDETRRDENETRKDYINSDRDTKTQTRTQNKTQKLFLLFSLPFFLLILLRFLLHQEVVVLTGATVGAGAEAAVAVLAAVVLELFLLALLEPPPPPPPVLLSSLTSICREPSSVPFNSWIAVWASS